MPDFLFPGLIQNVITRIKTVLQMLWHCWSFCYACSATSDHIVKSRAEHVAFSAFPASIFNVIGWNLTAHNFAHARNVPSNTLSLLHWATGACIHLNKHVCITLRVDSACTSVSVHTRGLVFLRCVYYLFLRLRKWRWKKKKKHLLLYVLQRE